MTAVERELPAETHSRPAPRRQPVDETAPIPTAVSPLAVVGTLLLGASTTIELSNADPHAELWVAVAAGTAFLTATGLSRGAGGRVLTIRGRLIGGAALSALLAVAALWQATHRSAPRVLLLLIPVFLLFSTAVLALREAGTEQRRRHLREAESRLAGEEWERRRWVRELHDDTLQELAAVQVLLAGATAPPAEETVVAEAASMVGHQIGTLRRLISRMRPLALDSLGLAAALEDLGHRTQPNDTEVGVYVEELPRLAIEAETHIYRIAQEALTNALRHARAGRITIEAHQDAQTLTLTVRDDGCGLPEPPGPRAGHGLLGMRERADILGAALDITDPDSGGTVVTLRVPRPGAVRYRRP